MNTNYIYYNGKATILEDNGNEKEINYYDKLEDVLERENLIEVLENKSVCLKNNISQINKDYRKSRKEYIDTVLWILFPLIIYGLSLVFTHFFGTNYINTSLGTFNFGVFESILTSFLTTPVGVILATANYKYRKTLQSKISKKEIDIKKIEKQITLQKKEIEELKKEKTNSVEDNYFIAKLSKVPNHNTIRNIELERLFNLLNKDLIIEDETQVEENVPVLKKTLR